MSFDLSTIAQTTLSRCGSLCTMMGEDLRGQVGERMVEKERGGTLGGGGGSSGLQPPRGQALDGWNETEPCGQVSCSAILLYTICRDDFCFILFPTFHYKHFLPIIFMMNVLKCTKKLKVQQKSYS